MSLPWLALAFLTGIVCVETREVLTPAALCASPLAVLALGALFLRPVLLVPLLAGALWAWWGADQRLADDLAERFEDRDVLVVGDVVSLPQRAPGQVQFDLAPLTHSPLPRKIRLAWYDPARMPRAGERWQLQVRLRPRRGFANPGGFDFEGQLFREHVGATGYVRESAANLFLGAGPRRPVLALRARIVERMELALGASRAEGVLIGLAVGHTSGISAETWRVFAATGTTHLVAISGLHVTMIATLVMVLARVTWRLVSRRVRWARTDVAALCGACAATAYSLLAGFSVPTQRTLAMLIVALLASSLRRSQPAANVLSLSLIAVLALDAHAVLTAGFWLSFLAVAAILVTARRERGPWVGARDFMREQAAVTLVLMPATLVLFSSVSAVAPLANLVAIPLFTLVLVPATLMGVTLIGAIPALGEGVLQLAARAFELAWPFFERAAQAPGALVYPPEPSMLLLVTALVSAVACLTVLVGRLRVLALVLLLPLLLARPVKPTAGSFDVTVLDVGQGLSVLVETRTHAFLYDTGPAFRSGRSAGDLAVVPVLHHRGIQAIDVLVVSHDDSDHAGGVAAIQRELEVRAERRGSRVVPGERRERCLRGDSWAWDGVDFAFLHPSAGQPSSDNKDGNEKDNDASCVLRISGPGGSLLLTGDIEEGAELRVLGRAPLARSDVVVVAHHGSRSSSSQAFVSAVGAQLAIVSAGYRNRWHFPHESVVARWCASGAQVVETASWGAVRIRVDAREGVQPPHGHRGEYRRYWHAKVHQPPRTLCFSPARQGP